MPTFKFTGDQPHVFTEIPDPAGNGTWVAQPGATIDLKTDPEHHLLELVNPKAVAKALGRVEKAGKQAAAAITEVKDAATAATEKE